MNLQLAHLYQIKAKIIIVLQIQKGGKIKMYSLPKLDKQNVEDIMSLTSTQEGMLFHYIENPNSQDYHEQISLTLSGSINLELVQKSWDHVIEMNEMLRTIFRWETLENPVQIVLKNFNVPIKIVDLSKDNDRNRKLEDIKKEDFSRQIDITRETLRITLCKMDERCYEMIVSNHHILYDGWSNGIILEEFFDAYNAFYKSNAPAKICKNKFKEFIKLNKSQDKLEQKEFWENYLKGLELENELLKDNDIKTKEIKKYKYSISMDISEKIRNYAKSRKISLASILYYTWGEILQRLSNSNDIVFGTVVSGRNPKIKGIDKIVGLFINTIPLRINFSHKETVNNLIKKIDTAIKERNEFSDTPLVDIKQYGEIGTKDEFISSIVSIENYPLNINNQKENIITLEKYSIIENTNFNMSLGIAINDSIELNFSYNEAIISKNIVDKFGYYFENILKEIVVNDDLETRKIKMLTREEKNKLICEFNNNVMNIPSNITIHELFEKRANEEPDNIAVIYKNERITYRELNEKSNSLARVLRGKSVRQNSIVGIMVEPSIEMIIAIIGIHKAGGAYLPIDPDCPNERIEFMLKDSKSKILLSQSKFRNKITCEIEIVELDNVEIYKRDKGNLINIATENDLAYLIYTSGTTGNPKGVLIKHKNVVNLTYGLIRDVYLGYGENLNVALISPYVFDASVKQIFSALLFNHTLVIAPKEIKANADLLIEFYNKNFVDISDGTPIHINELLNTSDTDKMSLSVKHFIVGGDVFKIKLAKKFYDKFKSKNIKFTNIYGPTECCVDSIAYHFDKERISCLKSLPIGKPLANVAIYILGKSLELLPIGAIGEIYIGGSGVGKGYIHNERLTEESFIDNPFRYNEKMYKTGDYANWTEDGNIMFRGRVDHQVKIRGNRIELAEIENRLLEYKKGKSKNCVVIKEAVVLDNEYENGDKYLCAYIVADEEFTVLELKRYLSQMLPQYMIPSYYIQVDEMPITVNGKINRKELIKNQEYIKIGSEYILPQNKIEEILLEIWANILERDDISINDNFFDLGGHSLKVTALISKIHKELDVKIPIKEIFNSPTIEGLAKYIESSVKNVYEMISAMQEREYYNVSFSQKRLYMLQQFESESTAYNMPIAFEIEGALNIERLENAFEQLIDKHEILRTYFEILNDEIVQKIASKVDFHISYSENFSNSLEDLMSTFIRPFDLNTPLLLRAEIVKIGSNKHILMFDMHHIISDGVSTRILIKELITCYEGKALGRLKIQYKDYAAWQNNLLGSNQMKKQERYWLNKLKGELPVLNIPTDNERAVVQSFEGNAINFKIDNNLTEKIINIAQKTGCTNYMVLLSAINILLSKYCEQEDIIIGTSISGRKNVELNDLIGMFVNTIVMRNNVTGDKTYREFLYEVKQNTLEAYENQDYPFDKLIDKLDLKRSTNRNALFDVMFTMQNMDKEVIKIKNLIFKEYNLNHKISKFDITFEANELDKEIEFRMQYSTKLFKRQTIERMIEHFLNILKSIEVENEVKINDIEIVTEEEKFKIIYEFNKTHSEYPRSRTIHEVFEEQVVKHPESIALIFDGKELNYQKLNEKANSLARELRRRGVKQDTIVGIIGEHSIEVIVGILAILKAGGAYLPIGIDYPIDRINYMLNDCAADILLIQNNLVDIDCIQANVQIMDLGNSEFYHGEITNLMNINTSRDLAYVMYTSGSTGEPKGTMVEHMNVLRLVKNTNYIIFEKNDRILSTGAITFDASTFEIWGALLNGLRLYLCSKMIILDVEKLEDLININKINILWLTSPLFNHLTELKLNIFRNLKYLLVGGDILSSKHINKVKSLYKNLEIINGYGPTENTTFSTCYNIKEECGKNIPIGKPTNNSLAYVVGDDFKIKPIGIPGELWVGGDGVARGYLNKSKLTAEKFINNPFIKGGRVYRTGDRARWLPDGNLEFLGRRDNQIKIRGFRVEIREIENSLLKHNQVNEAVVISKVDKIGNKYLCAFITLMDDLPVDGIKSYLSNKLPSYMIPSKFIKLKNMPLTVNGKVDRNALLEFEENVNLESECKILGNEIDKRLIELCCEVLSVKNIGLNDNFFDLGGHSLKASILASKIYNEFDVKIDLKDIFMALTIKQLSERISHLINSKQNEIHSAGELEYYPTLPVQGRIFNLCKDEMISKSYNMPKAYVIEGMLNVNKVKYAFIELIKRHEILRTKFKLINNQLVQIIDKDVEFNVEYLESEEESLEPIIEKSIEAFDLGVAPLFRVKLIKLNFNKYLLFTDMHHIIVDGKSNIILMKEFIKIYNGEELEPLKLQYKDFSVWYENILERQSIEKQRDYWLDVLKDRAEEIDIPTDFRRVLPRGTESESLKVEINNSIFKQVYNLAEKLGVSLFSVFLGAYSILISKYIAQENVLVGIQITGRDQKDLENMVGRFGNMLLIKCFASDNSEIGAFIQDVKENITNAYINQYYQFEELLTSSKKESGRNPLVDFMFIMREETNDKLEMDGLKFVPYVFKEEKQKYDLNLSVINFSDITVISFSYLISLFKRSTIEWFARNYVSIIQQIIDKPGIKIKDIKVELKDSK